MCLQGLRLLHVPGSLLPVALPRQRLFRSALLTRLQIKGMSFDLSNYVFLEDLALKAPQSAFHRLAVLQVYFCQLKPPPLHWHAPPGFTGSEATPILLRLKSAWQTHPTTRSSARRAAASKLPSARSAGRNGRQLGKKVYRFGSASQPQLRRSTECLDSLGTRSISGRRRQARRLCCRRPGRARHAWAQRTRDMAAP